MLNLTVEVPLAIEERSEGGVQCSAVRVQFWRGKEGCGHAGTWRVRFEEVVMVYWGCGMLAAVLVGPDLMVRVVVFVEI